MRGVSQHCVTVHSILAPSLEVCTSPSPCALYTKFTESSCRGPLAAAADNLGRVLLIDTWTMTVIRLWKSYRNAQMAWLTFPATQVQPPPLFPSSFSCYPPLPFSFCTPASGVT